VCFFASKFVRQKCQAAFSPVAVGRRHFLRLWASAIPPSHFSDRDCVRGSGVGSRVAPGNEDRIYNSHNFGGSRCGCRWRRPDSLLPTLYIHCDRRPQQSASRGAYNRSRRGAGGQGFRKGIRQPLSCAKRRSASLRSASSRRSRLLLSMYVHDVHFPTLIWTTIRHPKRTSTSDLVAPGGRSGCVLPNPKVSHNSQSDWSARIALGLELSKCII
jgi:hypothetical protein